VSKNFSKEEGGLLGAFSMFDNEALVITLAIRMSPKWHHLYPHFRHCPSAPPGDASPYSSHCSISPASQTLTPVWDTFCDDDVGHRGDFMVGTQTHK
jgi:hypothetical protein